MSEFDIPLLPNASKDAADINTGGETNTEAAPTHTTLTPALLRLMAITCGMSVANLYYNQPLLAQMERSFHASVQTVGAIPLLTQLGCATGMLLFVPMGDIQERRRLIVLLLLVSAVAMGAASLAPGLPWMVAASLAIGLTSVVSHLIVPFAAQLAPPAERGKAVGSVLSGLLIGILQARTVSGYVGAAFGWRSMYGIAAALMIGLALVLRRSLPQSEPSAKLTYRQMLASLWPLVRQQPTLREAAAIGALSFGAFMAFWTSLVFLLEATPYAYPDATASRLAGLFGLVGVVGAAAARIMGGIADRRGPRLTLGIALVATIASWGLFWGLGYRLWGLVVGVILLDFGVQSAHVSNQTRIYALLPEARSRLNTVYMVSYFVGGSVGSTLGAWGWSRAHWSGVCLVGLSLMLLAFFVYVLGSRKA